MNENNNGAKMADRIDYLILWLFLQREAHRGRYPCWGRPDEPLTNLLGHRSYEQR